MPVNPYQRYQQQSVMTMTPGEMLLKLYDEVITQLTAVRQFNEEKDYEKSNASLKKAQRIIRLEDGKVIYDGLPDAERIGGTTDLAAGQLIDRCGQLLGLAFPAGAAPTTAPISMRLAI